MEPGDEVWIIFYGQVIRGTYHGSTRDYHVVREAGKSHLTTISKNILFRSEADARKAARKNFSGGD